MELEPITRQEKIIAGQDLTPITRMEKFLKQFGGGGGGGGSVPKPLTYDYMPDGYPKKSVLFDIEWDGDTSGLVSVADSYYKVADYTAVTKADLVGCMLSLQNDPEHPKPFAVEENGINDTIMPHAIFVSDYVIFVSEPTSYGPFNFTEPGIYMGKNGKMYTARISKQTITPMAEEFLPNIVEIDSIIIKSSTTDSTKKFKITVDDSGTISATELT